MAISDAVTGDHPSFGEEAVIRTGLARLLSNDKRFTHYLSQKELKQYRDELSKKAEKAFKDYVRLGLLYLLDGNVYDAQTSFREALIFPAHRSDRYVIAVSSNILIAYNFLKTAKLEEAGAH